VCTDIFQTRELKLLLRIKLLDVTNKFNKLMLVQYVYVYDSGVPPCPWCSKHNWFMDYYVAVSGWTLMQYYSREWPKYFFYFA